MENPSKLDQVIEKLKLKDKIPQLENPKLHGHLNLKFQYFDFSTNKE